MRQATIYPGGLLNFDLDEQQTMLRDLVARFIGDHAGPEHRTRDRRDAEGFSRANWMKLAELGLLALPFGEADGGLGGGPVDFATVLEQLGRGLAIEPYLTDLLLAARLLARAGDAAQRETWLGRIIAGEARLALAHAEHAARYNPLLVQCEARLRGDAIEISGTKTFVLNGVGVDAFIVSTMAPGDEGGLALWLVPSTAAGLEQRSYRLTDGSLASELSFHRVRDAERLPGEARAALEATFDEVRVATCAELIGVMSALFDATLDHVRTRRQFGQPIGAFQAVQHRMADLYVMLEQSRSHLLRAALAADDAGRATKISAAKSFIAASAMKLGEEAIQLHGGMGVTDELIVGHGHKRILVLASLLGDAETELARYTRLAAA